MGDEVFAVSYDMIAEGIVKGFGLNQADAIQTNISAKTTNSDGSLLDTQGKVIGMNTKVYDIGGGFSGDAIQSNNITEIVHLLIAETNNQTELNKLNDAGKLLIEVGQYEGAIKVFDKTLSMDPDNANALYNKGIAS